MEQARSSHGMEDTKRKRTIPDQLVPPLSKCMGTGVNHNDDDLAGQIEQDYFVAGWMQKVFPAKNLPSHAAGDR
jgi:hypothetical protein